MADLEGTFVHSLEEGRAREAVAALLDLDSAIAARLRAGEDSPDLDNASATFRSLIVRLGEGATDGGDRETIDALVAGLVEARDAARANRDWTTADRIRDSTALIPRASSSADSHGGTAIFAATSNSSGPR